MVYDINMSTRDYHILECSKYDSMEDIKSKYKKLILKSHPDKGGSAEQFRKIQEAFENIKNCHGYLLCKICNGKFQMSSNNLNKNGVCFPCDYASNQYQKKCKRCSNVMNVNITFDECFNCRLLNMCKQCGKPVNDNKTDFCVDCHPKCNICGKPRDVIYFKHCRSCRLTKCRKCGKDSNNSVCKECNIPSSESSSESSASSESSESYTDEKAYTPGTKFSSDDKTADYKPPQKEQEKKKRSIQKCSKCGQTGHNKRSCKTN